jgi:Protein of unknown function (DUF3558)
MRTLRITLASLLLVAGCSTTESGEPTAGAGQTEEPTESATQPPETTDTTQSEEPSDVPTRPKNIDLSSVDICAVMNKVPVRKYGLDGRAPISGTSSVFPGNKDCYSGGTTKKLALTLIAVTDQDAGDFAETANAEVSEFDAQGYPLYLLEPEQPANCFGMLDVHDGQFVWIAYSSGGPADRPVTSQDKLCKTVPMIAASTVSALG